MTDQIAGDQLWGGRDELAGLLVTPGKWWPYCQLGLPQTSRTCLGYYERDAGRLQLRFGAHEYEGVCAVVVEEDDRHVIVRLILCYDEEREDPEEPSPYFEERTHAYLDRPLDMRTVIDFETGRPVPFYVPTWLDNRRTSRPGFYTDRDAAVVGLAAQSDDDSQQVTRRCARLPLRTLGY